MGCEVVDNPLWVVICYGWYLDVLPEPSVLIGGAFKEETDLWWCDIGSWERDS